MSQLTQKQNEPDPDSVSYCGCEESNRILNGEDKNVICMIRRRRASNCVVYRARTIDWIDSNGHDRISLDPRDPIEIFWIKLSKRDLKKHRESGKMDDRVKLTKLERKVVYGVTCKKITTTKKPRKSLWKSLKKRKSKGKSKRKKKSKKSKKNKKKDETDGTRNSIFIGEFDDREEKYDEKANPHEIDPMLLKSFENQHSNDEYKVVFNAFKSMDVTLTIDHKHNTPYLCGKTIIYGGEVECTVKEVWVTIKKGKMGLPKVDYLTVKACRCDNKEQVEWIINKSKYEKLK